MSNDDQDEKEPIYKEYKYPDGRVLRLTKEEFEKVCEVFLMLENTQREKEGRAPLLGPGSEKFQERYLKKKLKRIYGKK